MSKLLLLVGDYLSGWHGLWAVIAFGYEGGNWSEEAIRIECRHRILGSAREKKLPASDFYVWAGGRFRVATHRSPTEMDFEPYYRGQLVYPEQVPQLGLYKLADHKLTLCLVDVDKPRPSSFNSTEYPYQTLGELERSRMNDRI